MTTAPQQPRTPERLRLSGALFGFYAACTGMGIGVTVAASAWIVFGKYSWSTPLALVSVVIAAVCSVLSWWTLRLARGEV